jgi:hypothetical protein
VTWGVLLDLLRNDLAGDAGTVTATFAAGWLLWKIGQFLIVRGDANGAEAVKVYKELLAVERSDKETLKAENVDLRAQLDELRN